MNGTFWTRGLRVALIAFAALCVVWAGAGLASMGGDNSSKVKGATTQIGPAKTPVTAPTPKGLDNAKVAKAFAKEMTRLGFKPGQVRVGVVDWGQNPTDHRGGAFAKQMKTRQELTKFLRGDSPASRLARQHLLRAVPANEKKRVLDGANFVPVQYKVDVDYDGNLYVSDGQLRRGGSTTAKAGDVVWVFVTRDYRILWDGSVRADCSNPGFQRPPTPSKPHRPKTPPTPYTPPQTPPPSTPPSTPPPSCTHKPCHPTTPPSTPKCPPGQHGKPPICKDDPSQDPAAQGNAPEGGGKNEDPGPGVYQPNPPTFPSTPYTPPPAPKPTKTEEPRPDPIQPPATGAPDPTQAPTTCVPPPGKTKC